MSLYTIIPNIITYCNLLCGLGSIMACNQQQYEVAAWLLFFAVVCDLLDGKLARRMNVVSAFGKELDSLCDIVSFIIAPVVFALSLGYTNILALIIYGIFVVAGATRLARFNVKDGIISHHQGVPVPYNIAIVLLHFIFIHLNINYMFWVSLYAVFAILMLAPLRIPKI